MSGAENNSPCSFQKEGNDAPPPLSIKLPKLRNLPTKCKPWSDDQLPVDIVLLTMEDCEFLACYAYMRNCVKSYCTDLGFVFFGCIGDGDDDDDDPLKVALLKCRAGAQAVAKNAVMKLKPKAIFSVGCCEGLRPENTQLGDVVIPSMLTTEYIKTPVGKYIAGLIKSSGEGWDPPLEGPDARQVHVHRDGEILSCIDKETAKSHPRAIAWEMEGRGIFVAAHDLKMEWMIVKGISHFADSSKTPDESWKTHACVMAASLVFKMLNDTQVFKQWPHYEDQPNLMESHNATTVQISDPSVKSSPTTGKRKAESSFPETKFPKTVSGPPEVNVTLPKNKDLPKESVLLDGRQLPIDFLLLTVKDCEFLGCLAYMDRFFKSYHKDLGRVYLGDMGKAKVALMKFHMGSTGPGSSSGVVRDAIKILGPKAVFCVGFCRGLNTNKIKLGDVVVSEKLITYAPSKVTQDGIEERGVRVPLRNLLARLILNVGEGWKAPLKEPRELEVTIRRGALLSGPEVVNSNEQPNELIKRFPDGIAIEMEGEDPSVKSSPTTGKRKAESLFPGVFAAAQDLDVEWIIIKGVSDYADGKKSNTNSWRSFASLMAASLTAHILSDPIVFQSWPHYGLGNTTTPSSDLCGYVRTLLDVEGATVFNVTPIVRLVNMPEKSMIQILKFWKSEDEQLDMIMEYWKKENNAVEALAALRKDLKGLKQEDYKVTQRGQMHIRNLRKLTSQTSKCENDDCKTEYLSREIPALFEMVLTDCFIESKGSEECSKRVESMKKTYQQTCSLSTSESITESFPTFVPDLIQNIKEIFVDEGVADVHNGLRGLSEETLSQFPPRIRDAEQKNRVQQLVCEISKILELLCCENSGKQSTAQIAFWGESLALPNMLDFLEPFFKHCRQDHRLYMRLKHLSHLLKKIMYGLKDDFLVLDVCNVAWSLINFAKFVPSKLVRFQLNDSTNSPVTCNTEIVQYDKSHDKYYQWFNITKESEEELQLHATASVYADGRSLMESGLNKVTQFYYTIHTVTAKAGSIVSLQLVYVWGSEKVDIAKVYEVKEGSPSEDELEDLSTMLGAVAWDLTKQR